MIGTWAAKVPAMTGPGGPAGRPQDLDATVVIPAAVEADADATAVLPAVVAGSTPTLPPAAPTEPAEGGLARNSAVMALGSVVSRVTGFARTAAIGAAIGVVAIGNDYTIATMLPGMVYELLLGGVLASVVVPLLVRARDNDPDRGQVYAQRLLSLAVIALAVATVVAIVAAPLLTALFDNNKTLPDDRTLITTLSRLLLPMIFFYGLAALFAAILNTRGHFAAPTFAPILNNLVVIAMTLGFLFMPVTDPDEAGSLSTGQVALLGIGTTLGIVIQAAGLWPALRRVGFRWRWRWDFRALHLGELARVGLWMLVYVAVSQVAVVVVTNIAQRAADAEQNASGPAIYNNAFLIFMMAHGIVAVSIITALMPRMSAVAAQHRFAEMVDHISTGTRMVAVVLIPTTVAYAILGRPLAVTLFQFGNYGEQQAIATGWVIAVAGLGLVPFAISQLQLFAFYAMPDTRTPALINVPVVAVRIGVDILLFLVLPAAWVAGGLMAGNAISFAVAAVIGYVLLRRRIGRLGLTSVFATLGRLSAAALIAAVPTLLVVVGMTAAWGTGKGASIAQLLVGGIVLFGSYGAAAALLRVREVRDLTSMVRARVRR
jgi:putative peptidoglycan lipid II flippase